MRWANRLNSDTALRRSVPQQVSLSVLLFQSQTNDASIDEKPFSPLAERYLPFFCDVDFVRIAQNQHHLSRIMWGAIGPYSASRVIWIVDVACL
jgi:hypothetical protein